MKKITIILLALGIAFSYSCTKEGKMVQTDINGTLLTNGTSDKIKMSNEVNRPLVKLYEQTDGIDIYATGYKEIASVTVDENARYSFSMELNEQNTYFIGFRNLDTTIYISAPDSWSVHDKSYRFNYITTGTSNNLNLYCLAKSWVQPRFINTNPDPNNNDVFDLSYGVGPDADDYIIDPVATLYFNKIIGSCDSLAPWIYKTWGGSYKYGVQMPAAAHSVNAILTRNGITRDTSIIYSVPPFDTTVVIIRY